MDRCAEIDAIRDALAAAAGASDWERLGEAAAKLAPRVEALAAHGPWSSSELDALARLRDTHELAAIVCKEQQEFLVARMSELQNNKAGWTAYALYNHTEQEKKA